MRYLTTSEFMPYHAAVTGQAWGELSPGLQTIIVGMLRIVGGGFLACGLALAALAYPLHRGERWPPWATLLTGAALWVPTLAVTLRLQSLQPAAQPPVAPSAILLALVVLAAVAGWFASSRDATGR